MHLDDGFARVLVLAFIYDVQIFFERRTHGGKVLLLLLPLLLTGTARKHCAVESVPTTSVLTVQGTTPGPSNANDPTTGVASFSPAPGYGTSADTEMTDPSAAAVGPV